MSMIKCDGCDRIFDSDEDPDCFIEEDYADKQPARVICETCREEPIDTGRDGS